MVEPPSERPDPTKALLTDPISVSVPFKRRQARLTEFGFSELDEYLKDRIVGRGWPRRRRCVELGVGYDWLNQQLTRLGLRLCAAGLDGQTLAGRRPQQS